MHNEFRAQASFVEGFVRKSMTWIIATDGLSHHERRKLTEKRLPREEKAGAVQ
jgi:hypothetical protein